MKTAPTPQLVGTREFAKLCGATEALVNYLLRRGLIVAPPLIAGVRLWSTSEVAAARVALAAHRRRGGRGRRAAFLDGPEITA